VVVVAKHKSFLIYLRYWVSMKPSWENLIPRLQRNYVSPSEVLSLLITFLIRAKISLIIRQCARRCGTDMHKYIYISKISKEHATVWLSDWLKAHNSLRVLQWMWLFTFRLLVPFLKYSTQFSANPSYYYEHFLNGNETNE
jgi:hypothetical protein